MVDSRSESEKHEEIVSNNGRNVDVEALNKNTEMAHDYQPSLDDHTSQGTNITSVDGNSRFSHVGALAKGTGTMVAPSETTVDDSNNSTDYDSNDSYMFYDYGDATESDDEESNGNNNTCTPISALSSKLHSCKVMTDSSNDEDATTGVVAIGNVLVVAGCRMCLLYIMVPKGTSVCFQCGNSGLIHLDGNGQC